MSRSRLTGSLLLVVLLASQASAAGRWRRGREDRAARKDSSSTRAAANPPISLVQATETVLRAAYGKSPRGVREQAQAVENQSAAARLEALRPTIAPLIAGPTEVGRAMYKLGYAHVSKMRQWDRYSTYNLYVYHANTGKFGIPVANDAQASLWLVPTEHGQLNFVLYQGGASKLVLEKGNGDHDARWTSGIDHGHTERWDTVLKRFPGLDGPSVERAVATWTDGARAAVSALP